MNAVEIEAAVSDLAAAPYDASDFPFQFLAAFDKKETTLKRLRKGDSNKSDVPGAILLVNNIHLATCPAGQTRQTLDRLRTSSKTASARAKFIFATDGSFFEAEDATGTQEPVADFLPNLANHFGFFLPLAGISTVREIKDNPIDVRATGRLNKLYVELLRTNPDWGTAARRHDMNHFMARLIFCYFAEHTDIFHGTRLFTDTLERMSEPDGSNTHLVMEQVFRAMDIKPEDRAAALSQDLPLYAGPFPYVNGGLFRGSAETPQFNRIARSYLLQAGKLEWQHINPDIFGSMIQAVADDEERGALGMHYTSVPNILKVLNPLFLDDLRAQLEAAGSNTRMLLNLRQRMSHIRVFDPACGSGNFLVIAYKEMRSIEAQINELCGESRERTRVLLTNFRGVEIRDFPAQIARLALVIAEYQCDVLYRGQLVARAEFLPLDSSNWITCGNALRLKWLTVCPPENNLTKIVEEGGLATAVDENKLDLHHDSGELYIFGNPPYLGSKKKSAEQVDDMVTVGLSDAKLLDYVCGFIVNGLDMIQKTNCVMALVSTSSICQGEQVSLLWPRILARANIKFAYRPFKWANSAANNAGVFCTIIGFGSRVSRSKQLFGEDNQQECQNISPYLIQGSNVICSPRDKPLSNIALMKMGSNPVDGKRLVLSTYERNKVVHEFTEAVRFFKKYGGLKEMVAGTHRWCLWVSDESLAAAWAFAPIRAIIERCKKYREGAGRDGRKAARRPHAFCYSTFEDRPFIQVGKTIGNTFKFVPTDLKQRGFVSNDNVFTIYGVHLPEFSLIVETLHRVWAETVAGRLGDGTRYGNTIVYNTFPVPTLTDQNKADLTRCAEDILLAREAHFPATIGDLYDPETMPQNLRDAHDANDETLERIYIGRRFRNDTERLEKLFEMYTKTTATSAPVVKPAAKRATAVKAGRASA